MISKFGLVYVMRVTEKVIVPKDVHTCKVCNGRHPTGLLDENFVKNKVPQRSTVDATKQHNVRNGESQECASTFANDEHNETVSSELMVMHVPLLNVE